MAYKKKDKELKREEKQGSVTESVQIPVGSADVKEMIAQKLYADKTAYIAKLFRTNGIYYFFTRPRRFGKSLLLDTIDQIAKCNKALFKGCAIYEDKIYKWKKYPVIWLNFSELVSKEPGLLEEDLKKYFYRVAETYNIKDKLPQPTGKDSIQSYFIDLMSYLINLPYDRSYARKPIVLIDEYESPLISCEKEQYEEVLAILSSFFKVLKARQKDCKFIFVTGVTKFHLSGLTSGANSDNDISLHQDYAGMLGYTEEDIDNLFFKGKQGNIQSVIENLKAECGKDEGYTAAQLKQDLKDYYNGYYFTRGDKQGVYNPDSILRFFYAKDFENSWFNSGSPTILLQQMKQNIHRFNMDWNKCNFPIDKIRFKLVHPSLYEMPLLPLMYQTGYLTMDLDASHMQDKNNSTYYLKFPNQEVKSSLKLILADFILQAQQEAGKACSNSILESLRQASWITFLNIIRSDCLAKSGYRFLDKTEKSFQGTLYSFLNGAFHTTYDTWAIAERDSGIGRMDMRPLAKPICDEQFLGEAQSRTAAYSDVCEEHRQASTPKLPLEIEFRKRDTVIEDQYNGQSIVYIFELKVDKPACNALEQIHNKDYSIQYGTCHKKVLIGLTCDSVKLNITEAVIEVHQKDDQNEFNIMPHKHFTVNAIGYFQEVGAKTTES